MFGERQQKRKTRCDAMQTLAAKSALLVSTAENGRAGVARMSVTGRVAVYVAAMDRDSCRGSEAFDG